MISELEALLILTGIPLLGSIKIRLLLQRFGSALAVLEADPGEIAELPGVGPKLLLELTKWRQDSSWKKNLELAARYEVEIIPYTSPLYPKRLLEIVDLPILLYVKGEIKNCDQRSIAIVGTRHASIYGNEMAEKIARELAEAGFTVVSGLARGIDTSAHRGALHAGRTIGVIGSGLADIYPTENIELARAIVAKGAIISEFAMATPPDRQNFPQRNRIVSGMTMATLLVEAPIKSGAMITMDKAQMQKRPLFALCGRVDDENFKGNHLLIKSGQAQLVESAHDLIENFSDLFSHSSLPPKAKPLLESSLLEKEEFEFLKKLPTQEISVDEIVNLTKLPVMKVNVLVMSLVLKKALKEFPGRIYKKLLF